jgi:HAE1 family hydrophobic/amphiphilic exporter-1
VLVTFVLEKNIDVAAQEVRDRIARIIPDLPEDVDAPIIEKLDPDAAPILNLALVADKPVREITEFADKVLRRQLKAWVVWGRSRCWVEDCGRSMCGSIRCGCAPTI